MRVQAPFLGVYYIGLEIRIWDLNVGVEIKPEPFIRP